MTEALVRDRVARHVLPCIGDALAKGDGGVVAILWGASGTGRTIAAKLIADKLKYQLVQVDLGRAVDKYIGETEKNLRSMFKAASKAPTVLFFDEADALFGKRTGVKDAHDRYANLETSYLLEQMGRVRGVVVLSTNKLDDLDGAFVKRARCIVCLEDD